MYDCKYQSNDDFNDSSLNSLSNQSSTVLNGYENECNGQEKVINLIRSEIIASNLNS